MIVSISAACVGSAEGLDVPVAAGAKYDFHDRAEDKLGPIARNIFLTKGVGRHREKLTSFELALRDARIAEFNLVRVSSIFPLIAK